MPYDDFIKSLEQRGDVVYIVDRGLIRFAKFAAVLFAILGIIGFFFFGMDMKKASDEIKAARFDTMKASVELKETQFESKKASGELKDALAETKKAVGALEDAKKQLGDVTKFIDEVRKEIQVHLDEIRESAKGAKDLEHQAETQLKSLIKMRDDANPITANAKIRVAFVSEVKELNSETLNRVVSALQIQISRDAKPIWHVDAALEVFASLQSVPAGVWLVIIKNDIGMPAGGVHLDKDGVAYSLVTYLPNTDWSLAASHELLDMLVDPFGRRFMPGPSPNPADKSKIVNFLVEIAQPVQGLEHSYAIDGIAVSDFVFPGFYDDVSKSKESTSRYSFSGAAKEPRKVTPGGYMSWQDRESGDWYQATWFDGKQPKFRNIGKIN